MRSSYFFALALGMSAIFAVASHSNAVQQAGPYIYPEVRGAVRCVNFTNAGIGGSYSIDYGTPEWKADYDQKFDDLTLGKRIRFGQNRWTELDTNTTLMINDKEVKPGLYYLAFERNKKGDFAIVLLDSNDIRKSRVDPAVTEQTKGGVVIPFKSEKNESSTAKLTLELKQEGKSAVDQSLTILWGPHKLTGSIKLKGG